MKITAAHLVLVAALVTAAFAEAVLVGNGGHPSAPGARAAGAGFGSLRLSGQLRGLYPGARRWMRVAVRSEIDAPVRLRWLGARVTSVRHAAPGCPPRALKAQRRRRLRRLVPAGRKRVVRVLFEMRSDAPDACQAAVFRLRFRAGASLVGGG